MRIEDKEVTIINDVIVEPTNMKIIEFDDDPVALEDGVNKTINGYNSTLVDILQSTYHTLKYELEGTQLIAEMKPDTQLFCENLYLDENLYDIEYLFPAENPAISITDEIIEDAKYAVKQYKYLLKMFDLMINGVYKVEKCFRE